MVDYVALSERTSSLIGKFGAPVKITRTAATDYDASTSEAEGSFQTRDGIAVRLSYSLREVDGDLIQASDVRFLCSIDAKPGDTIAFAGERWRVLRSEPKKPATVALYYDVQARK